MDLSWPLLFMLAGLAAFSAAVQGLTGLGFSLVGMGLASMVLGPRNANLVWTLLAGPIALSMAWRLRRYAQWQLVGWMLIGLSMGLPVGVYALAVAPASVLSRIIGGVIGLFAVYYLLNPPVRRHHVTPAWGIPAGAVSGVLAGLTNMSGPPAVVFLLTLGLSKNTLRATLAVYFLAGMISKTTMLVFWQDLLRVEHALMAATMLPPLTVGIAAGMYVSRYVSTQMIQKIICLLLIIPAAMLLLAR